MIADMESLEKRYDNLAKKAKQADKESKELIEVIDPILAALKEGKPARSVKLNENQKVLMKSLQLLTSKPVLYVCNVEENEAATGNALSQKVAARAKTENADAVVISAKIESEVAVLNTDEEKKEFLSALGLEEPGLNKVIRAGHNLLNLITYFTIGPKEAHAWTIIRGTKAPAAAGVIHTDFEKGFICAETIAFEDYEKLNGEQGAKDSGKMRLEGKEYVMHDGDVVHFRFNV
jgi:GTP-binding protein YchF